MIRLSDYIQNAYLNFDVEYGNADSFYSASKRGGFSSLKQDFCAPKNTWFGSLQRTELKISDDISLTSNNVLLRKTTFDAVADSYLFDMVSRFVVYSDNDRAASIAGREFNHKSVNLYRQFGTLGPVRVPIGKSQWLEFSAQDVQAPDGFEVVFYIRDECRDDKGFRWIVHHRVIAVPSLAELILRGCHPRFEGPLKLSPVLPKFFKRLFFRIRERLWPNFPFMSVSELVLQKGKCARLETEIKLVS